MSAAHLYAVDEDGTVRTLDTVIGQLEEDTNGHWTVRGMNVTFGHNDSLSREEVLQQVEDALRGKFPNSKQQD